MLHRRHRPPQAVQLEQPLIYGAGEASYPRQVRSRTSTFGGSFHASVHHHRRGRPGHRRRRLGPDRRPGPAAAPAAAAPALGQYISVSGGLIGKADYDYGFAGGFKADTDVDSGAQGAIAWGSTIGGAWRAEIALGYRSQNKRHRRHPERRDARHDRRQDQDAQHRHQRLLRLPRRRSGEALSGRGRRRGPGQVQRRPDRRQGRRPDAAGHRRASFAVSPTLSLFAEGRYQYTGAIKIKTTSPSGEQTEKLSMTAPGLLVGARFAF